MSTLPDQTAIVAMTEVARSSIEGVDYAFDGYIQVLKKAGILEQSAETVSLMQGWANGEKFKLLNTHQPWDGQVPVKNDYVNMLVNKANAVVPNIAAEVGKGALKLDIIIDESVQLGFSKDNQPIAPGDKHLIAPQMNLNDCLMAQLTADLGTRGVRSQGGALYNIDEKGEIQKDINKQPIKTDLEELRQSFSDPSVGFASAMEQKGIPITVVQHKAPVSRAEAAPAAPKEVKVAIEAKREARPAEPDVHEPDSTTPSPD